MSDSSPFREFPSYIEQSPRRSRKMLVILSVSLVIILCLTGLYFLGVNSKKAAKSASPVAKNVPTVTPSPTVLPTSFPSVAVASPTPGKKSVTPTAAPMDRSALRIAVLNGSGVAGAAKGVSAYLNGLGYTIKSIGNADGYTYKNITIRVKKAKSAYLPLLKKDLEANAKTSTVSASISENTTADADVIVGK